MYSLDEVLNLLKCRYLNSKNNNHIITQLTPEERKLILNSTINGKMYIQNFNALKDEYYISNAPYLRNVIIDLSNVSVKEIFILALEMLDINDKIITFDDWKSILKFRALLKEYGEGIQFIFYNPGFVKPEEQVLINHIFALSEYLYNSNFLLLEGEELSTYMGFKGKMLDSREDYMKIVVRH